MLVNAMRETPAIRAAPLTLVGWPPVGRSWRGGGLRRGPSACWLPPHVRAGDLLHSFADLSDRDDALQRCPRPPEPPRAVFSGRDIDEFGDFDKPPPAASHLYARVRQVP